MKIVGCVEFHVGLMLPELIITRTPAVALAPTAKMPHLTVPQTAFTLRCDTGL